MLEFLILESDFILIREIFINNIFDLIKDSNGNHVVQKLISTFPLEKIKFIIDEISENILEISKLKQGTCIFQKVIEKACYNEKVNLYFNNR